MVAAASATPTRGRSWIRFTLPASALLVAAGLAQLAWGERVPVSRGAGWDGREYAQVAADPQGALEAGRIDRYRIRRLMPSLLAHATLAVVDRAATVGRLARVFGYWNIAFLVLTCGAWASIARSAGISWRGRWLGFVLLFVNFATLRMPFYYPILTDCAALFLGAALLLFHLRGRTVAMAATLLMASFTWPALVLFGAPLFVFPRRPLEDRGGHRGRAV